MAKKKKKLTKYDYFEVMDRASISSANFNYAFFEHNVIANDKRLRKKFFEVSDLMGEFYQLAAEKCFNFKD